MLWTISYGIAFSKHQILYVLEISHFMAMQWSMHRHRDATDLYHPVSMSTLVGFVLFWTFCTNGLRLSDINEEWVRVMCVVFN